MTHHFDDNNPISNYLKCSVNLNQVQVSLFVWFDSLRPINDLSVIKGRVFLGWTSTKLGFMFLLKDTHSDAGEARTRGPSVSSQALYHWATALPRVQVRLSKQVLERKAVWLKT